MSFESFGLTPDILSAIAKQQYIKPYPVQEAAIPPILNKKDILGIAKTGSGKTAAYVLPLLSLFPDMPKSKNRHIKILVVVPTRELAVQVAGVFKLFGSEMASKVKILPVYGGASINTQMIALQNVDILVATPGRLLELVDSNAVHLSNIHTLVLDEADKMLNLGFKKEMNRIIGMLPAMKQNLLFSATLSEDLSNIQMSLLNSPIVIKIDSDPEELDLINQTAYSVSEDRKGPLMRYLIKTHNWNQILVFTSSIKRADNVASKLRANGIDANAIHSKKSQGVRTDLLTKFKHGKLAVLVTTDLLSRGIDIEFLPYVINYELPRSPKDYIHRIGRTGRAESPGEAISFISPDEEHHFKVIQKKIGKTIDMTDSLDLDLKGY